MAYYRALIWLCTYLMLIIVSIAEDEYNCDRSKCPAPLVHYLALNCEPVYEADYCCPVRYNCDHLYRRMNKIMHRRMKNKCYYNDNDYEIGEMIGEEDPIFCEKGCICVNKEDNIADFNCNCREKCLSNIPTKIDCYQRNSRQQCCPVEICHDAPEEMSPTCTWNGEIYSVGNYIMPRNKPKKLCVCEETGPGTARIMCAPFRHWFDTQAAYYFYKGCAPVYLLDERGFIDIHTQTWRCQNANDIVYDKNYRDPESKESRDAHGPLRAIYCPKPYCGWLSWLTGCGPSEPCLTINTEGRYAVTYEPTYRELCRFGQMTMHIGDQLNEIGHGNNSCIVCICLVPPVPTCVLKPNESCQTTVIFFHLNDKCYPLY